MIRRHAALTLLALASCAGAWAQSADRPYYVGVKQDFTHDSNVFSSPSGPDSRADTVSTTTLLGGLNLPIGRQRAYLNASLFHQAYKNVTARNNSGHDLGAGLDWSTIEHLSGNVALASYRHQAPYYVGGVVPVTLSNIESSDDASARFRLGLDSALAFDASLGHRRVRFSALEFAAQEYKQDSASLGVTYRPSGILSLGVGASGQRTSYESPAFGQTTADKNKGNSAYITANWVPTGASSVNARINFSRTSYEIATAANFSGATGSLTWSWKPTGLLALSTTLLRDTGQNAGFLQSSSLSAQTAANFSRLTNSVQVRADYDLTAKLKLSAVAGDSRRNLVGAGSAAPGTDNTRSLSLGASWAALRTLSLGCDAARDSRTATGIGTAYDDNRFGCFGQLTLD